jgi:uncharacterized protein YjiS (DUF1127 family)
LRVGDGVADAASAATSALRSAWSRWQSGRARAAEFRALRELSPSVLRDIGAAPELVDEALHRDERAVSGRDALLRLM